MKSDEQGSTKIRLGESAVIWYVFVLISMVVFGGGFVSLVWPGFQERWFDTPSGTTLEWALWIMMMAIALAFTLYFARRLWAQVTLKATDEGICQSTFPGRRRCLRWWEVTRVERPGHGNQVVIESPSGVVRIVQDAYKDPDQLYRFLTRVVPEDAEGWERLKVPTP